MQTCVRKLAIFDYNVGTCDLERRKHKQKYKYKKYKLLFQITLIHCIDKKLAKYY